ncbi:MAG: hypothetical protein HN842_05355 [Gammaproteobacteria bacterium]|nr:hypothetical protein [Gammaproteobacteria bacterium]MBT7307623.1 hypothetical protein [Gammaproteobacteria bacterium]
MCILGRMTTITFDTHQLIRDLRDADFTEKQVVSQSQERLLSTEHFDSSMTLIDSSMALMEARMTIKLGAMLVVAVTVMVALIKVL